MIWGEQWTCSCGWENVFVRRKCRNCGKERLTPILLDKAVPLPPAVRADIQRMVENEGVWIATDENQPGAEIPIISIGGKLRAIKLDTELDPARFLPTVRLSGPFRAVQAAAPQELKSIWDSTPADLHEPECAGHTTGECNCIVRDSC